MKLIRCPKCKKRLMDYKNGMIILEVKRASDERVIIYRFVSNSIGISCSCGYSGRYVVSMDDWLTTMMATQWNKI